MTYDDVLAFVAENPVFTISTLDGDQPRARCALSVMFEGDDRIYFTTGTMKAFGRQLVANPKVELCYHTPDYARMLRITGEVEFVDDRVRKQKLIDERDYLKERRADEPEFLLCKIARGYARFWTLADNCKEDSLPRAEF